ncbi:MAG TPA: FGLLP motif-containing membrane protein [Candidatus Limnocylindrales bacterium]|nr:FGLLP motif-containing membrane protein [Candidatus Limnocylindrales bacterium]
MGWLKSVTAKVARTRQFNRRMRASLTAGIVVLVLGVSVVAPGIVQAQNGPIASKDETAAEADNASVTFSFTIPTNTDISTQTVTFSTLDDPTATNPATAGQDYTPVTQRITVIPGGEPTTVSVPIINDTIQETDETFLAQIIYPCPPESQCQPVSDTWQATILANDVPRPPDSTPIVPPAVTNVPPAPTPPPSPAPAPTPVPTRPSTIPVYVPVREPELQIPPVQPEPVVLSSKTTVPEPQPMATTQLAAPSRSVFVRSVPDPTELTKSVRAVITSLVLAAILILLIAFPADMFNSTLQSNYDEIAGWFKLGKLKGLTRQLRKTPTPIAVSVFAVVGALINSQLSPDFGWNRASLALLLGMIITIIIAALLYDISRALYLRRRYKVTSKLRIHVLGLMTGGILVAMSRLSHFLPGYFYGMFTALVYGNEPADEQDGEGLAISSILLLAVAAIGWFAWIPVKHAATKPAAGLPILVLDATLASLWVSALSAIVFALAPLRFFYGEQVKKWSSKGWLVIYSLGMSLFVYTLIHPGQNFYGTSDKTTLRAVLTLFIGFGVFSLIFWGYFRYRPARTQSSAKQGV